MNEMNFEELTLTQAQDIIADISQGEIANEIKERIRKRTLAKLRKQEAPERKLRTAKGLGTCAAVIVFVFCIMWAVGFDNVASAAKKVLYFIPGFGIQEEELTGEVPVLTLEGTGVSASNDKCTATITSAMSTDAVQLYTQSDPSVPYDISSEKTPGIAFCISVHFNEQGVAALKSLLSEVGAETFSTNYANANSIQASIVSGKKTYDANGAVFVAQRGISGSMNGLDNMAFSNMAVAVDAHELKAGNSYTLTLNSPLFGEISLNFTLVEAMSIDDTTLVTRMAEANGVTVTAVKSSELLYGKEFIRIDFTTENGTEFDIQNGGFTDICTDQDNDLWKLCGYVKDNGSVVEADQVIGTSWYFDASKVDDGDKLYIAGMAALWYNQDSEQMIFTVPVPETTGQKITTDVEVGILGGKVRITSVELVEDYTREYTTINGTQQEVYPGRNLLITTSSEFEDLNVQLNNISITGCPPEDESESVGLICAVGINGNIKTGCCTDYLIPLTDSQTTEAAFILQGVNYVLTEGLTFDFS